MVPSPPAPCHSTLSRDTGCGDRGTGRQDLFANNADGARLLPRVLLRACVLKRMSGRIRGCAGRCDFSSMDGSGERGGARGGLSKCGAGQRGVGKCQKSKEICRRALVALVAHFAFRILEWAPWVDPHLRHKLENPDDVQSRPQPARTQVIYSNQTDLGKEGFDAHRLAKLL